MLELGNMFQSEAKVVDLLSLGVIEREEEFDYAIFVFMLLIDVERMMIYFEVELRNGEIVLFPLIVVNIFYVFYDIALSY